MSALPVLTADAIACAMCALSPDGPGVLEDRGSENAPGYFLCVDRTACLYRAIAAQKAASEATRAALQAVADEHIAAREAGHSDAPAAEAEAPVQAPEGESGTEGETPPEAAEPAAGDGCLVPPAPVPDAAPDAPAEQPPLEPYALNSIAVPAKDEAAGDEPAEAEAAPDAEAAK